MTGNDPQAPAIMVVDDEQALRSFAEILLQDLGYSVLLADSGRAAVQLVLQGPEAVSAVLLDMTMPGLPPEETFRMLKEIRADLPILILSGDPETSVRQRFGVGAIAGYVEKPYTEEDLDLALKQALSKTAKLTGPVGLVRLSADDMSESREEFLTTCRQDLTKMQTMLTSRDFPALRTSGHSLKGSGGCFGFPDLTEAGRALEKFAELANVEGCQTQLASIEACMDHIATHKDSVAKTFRGETLGHQDE